jgi:hypothetical protein
VTWGTRGPINTKVELVVESLEDLANAIFDGRHTDRHDKAAVDSGGHH